MAAHTRNRLLPGRDLWTLLPNGGHHPFGLRAAKAEVLLLVGRWAELEELYERDLGLAEDSGLRERQAYLLMKQGELWGRRSQPQRAEELLIKAMELHAELGDKEQRARCENGLAGICIMLKQYDRAEVMVDRAMERVRCGDEVALGWQLNNKAVICKRRGQLDRALELLCERMAIARRSKRPREIAISHMNLGVVHLEMGDYQKAYGHNLKCVKLSRRIGDVFNIYYAVYNMAIACERMGRKDESLSLFKEDLELARQLGDGPGAEQLLGDIARVEDAVKAQGSCPY